MVFEKVIRMSVLSLISAYEGQVMRTLNLVASENLTSANVRAALASDLSHRYCIPPVGERPVAIWDYPNQEVPRAILAATEELARALFHAAIADVRPLSGNQVAQIVLTTLVGRNDMVWSVPGNCGGHFTTEVVARREGIRLVQIPYDWSRGIIDVAAAAALAREAPPKLIFLDASMQLFPHPLEELRAAIGPDTIISYDASHTFGLIAGGHFQDPLREGADLLHGSTHKSLWGPQKGMILAREHGQVARALNEAVVPMFASNVHLHHVAALGIALEEARNFGAAYASRVVANARALGAALAEAGIEVLFADRGITDSHQVLVSLGDQTHALECWRRLEAGGLHANAVSLPFREGTYGLRLGTAEAARRGLGPAEMIRVGGWIAACCRGTLSPPALAAMVADLSRAHPSLAFADDTTDGAEEPCAASLE
ncbi:serine hydroxymethyltransferase [Rhodospirillum sp. A1_3_36]|uniref:serine hydroxymethyltransferase n=1 Tax=Rhodospirillum sp. A1_3_36 TaxID=3391666 RepID=UPI0039A56DE2